MKYPREWEDIPIDYVSRLRIHGGWLVRHHGDLGTVMVFVPDPNHEWVIE
jgi:hypothetical protein